MPIEIVAEQTINVGQPCVVDGRSKQSQLAVVFEDDGDTGYLYGLDFSREGNPIVDALQIYNVAEVIDRNKPSLVKLGWSVDGLKAVLLINGYPHAVLDFAARRGYCRTGFPPPLDNWSEQGHGWDDTAIDLFH
jgi:hypothetical protein